MTKQYNNKVKEENANIIFLFMKVLAATIFLGIIFIFQPKFCWTTFFFALGFACSFSICLYSSFMAIKTGPLSLSALISSFAILLPSLYSVIFLGESFTKWSVIGLVLLCVSFVLINKIEKGEKFNFRWLFFVSLSFLGNGINSILQKVHQETLKSQGLNANDYAVAFQFFAMIAVTLIFTVMLLIKRPKNMTKICKQGFLLAPLAGIANAGCNVLMLVLATMLSGVVLYPSISAGGIVFTFITALILYKERYTKWQYVGYSCGLISIILLSI
ncbi:MAG: EamA family transporter [Clostridia bacterium]|nr:EamA family transporter [Clostridia bacterium]